MLVLDLYRPHPLPQLPGASDSGYAYTRMHDQLVIVPLCLYVCPISALMISNMLLVGHTQLSSQS